MKKSKLQTEFDSPDESPGFLLWQISNKWQSQQRKALSIYGLTHVQFVLLASLVWAAENTSFTQKQLAAHAKTDVMMTSQVVRVLEQKGLLSRATSTTDARSFTLLPTKNGVELANKSIKAVEEVDKYFFARLGKNLCSFIEMMGLLAD